MKAKMASESSFFVFCAAFVAISTYVGSHLGPSHSPSRTDVPRELADGSAPDGADQPAAEAGSEAAARALRAMLQQETRACHQYLGYGIAVVSDKMSRTGTPAATPSLEADRLLREAEDPDLEVVVAYMIQRADSRPIPAGAGSAEAWMRDLVDDGLRFCLGYFERKRPATLR